MFSSAIQSVKDYYEEIPEGSLINVCSSGVVSFAINVVCITVLSSPNQIPNLSRAYVASGIAMVATAINDLIHPLFNRMFDNKDNEFNSCQEFINCIVVITFTHSLINYAITPKVNLITTVIPSGTDFICLPSNIWKTTLCVATLILETFFNTISPGSIPTGGLHKAFGKWNIDFSANEPPLYLVF